MRLRNVSVNFCFLSKNKMLAYRNFAAKLLPRLQSWITLNTVRGFRGHRTLCVSVSGFQKQQTRHYTRTSGLITDAFSSTWSQAVVSQTIRPVMTSSILFDNSFKTVVTPAFAESVSEGDVKWEKGVGDYVEEDEVIAEIETDKTSISIPAPVSGIIEEIIVPDGETVQAGSELCKIKITDAASSPTPKSKVEPSTSPPPTPETTPIQPPSVAGSIPTTPPPIPPIPSEPIREEPSPPRPHPTPLMTSEQPSFGSRTERRVKISRMRQRIAERLKEAQNVNAMLTTFNEVDMSNIIEMRKKHQESFIKKHGIKLGFMSPFIKASCFALQHQPVVNAVIEGNEIVYRDYVDISVAVATPKGLVVPVIRNVDTMNYSSIEKNLHSLGEKAKEGSLAIEEMDGGTFTVSNGGVFGSMFGTPIINPPQSAILGMHGVFDRPVAIDGKVEIRPMMYIALTYDHRLIDGREAVLFLRKIKSAIEDPRVLLLDI